MRPMPNELRVRGWNRQMEQSEKEAGIEQNGLEVPNGEDYTRLPRLLASLLIP
jgi:hypothetical protein